jgi:hypothetical protein
LRLYRFGCPSLEDAHHIFLQCPVFDNLWDKYQAMLTSQTNHLIHNSSLPSSLVSHLEDIIAHLFHDEFSWPLASLCFYLGLLPPLLPTLSHPQPVSPESLHPITRLGHCCHILTIHLAAHIWGTVVRQLVMSNSNSGHANGDSHAIQLQSLHHSLLPHLCYLSSL